MSAGSWRQRRLTAALAAAVSALAPASRAQAPIPIMILDGESGGPYHDWARTTPALRSMLDETRLFAVTVVTAPPAGADFSGFRPAFDRYRAVVLNYDAPDERWPGTLKSSFEAYVRGGGGVIAVHAANNAFPGWAAYNEMLGVGGWRGRTEAAGPRWFYDDGRLVSDSSPGPAGSHGKRLPFEVRVRAPDHPIVKGLPATWTHGADELYARLRGPGRNMTVLATAYSDPANAGSGRHEPQLMVLSFGKGRIFHTTWGHDLTALASPNFKVTFQRGTEWAATGAVTAGAAALRGARPVAEAQEEAAAVLDLRCEYLSNPSGIDVLKPRLSWRLSPAANMRAQRAYRVLVASTPELLRQDRGDLWDSGRVASAQTTWIPYGGNKLGSGRRAYWKVRVWSEAGTASPWSAQATWSMGLLQPSDWNAKWIGEKRPDGVAEGAPLSFPWLRKSFTLPRKPNRAVAYVNPLGYYELYINGRKVDDHVLSPAVSDYSTRNLYVAHEVAGYLVPGQNVIALWLGRGWYVRGHPGVIHDGPLVRARLDITLDGGDAARVVTDETWKIRASSLTPLGRGTAFGDYGGERYDPALELAEWNAAGLDDSAWQNAAVFDPPSVLTAAQMVEPNRIVETIKARRVEAYPQGGWVIDMGKNFTGWLEIKLPPAAKRSIVRLEYSDQMEPDKPAGAAAPAGRGGRGGNQAVFPYTFNQRDEVVANGAAITFRSRFNYHAFRYVRVLGVETAPDVSDATGYLIRTAFARTGEFTSSNNLLNQIYEMVIRTYEALTLGGYVVDTPTRERLGYGGDAGTSMETGMLNFSAGGLYNSWLANWRDSQVESGSLPHTAPNYPGRGGGGPMWGGFVVTLPWHMYLHYGDKGVLDTNYPMIQKWLGYLAKETEDDLLLTHTSHAISDNWNFLGDWLTPKGSFRGSTPPAQLINSVHYVYQLQLASEIATVLGRKADASAYDARAAVVSKAVHRRFFNASDFSYANGDSIQAAFPLFTGIVPPDLRKGVMQKLENTIRVQNKGHLDTGMHGTYFLLKYLMQADRNDLVFEMASQTDYPGWGYMLANGATTSWESWTGQSHIHDTLLSIGAWFTQGLAGIQSDGESPGFLHFVIEPAVVGDLTFVRAKYRSIHGDIVSDWRVVNETLTLTVTVPPGTTATVVVPGDGPVRTRAQRSVARGASDRSFEVAPGTHVFETAWRAKR